MAEHVSMQIVMRLRQIVQEMAKHSKHIQDQYDITVPQLICLKEVASHGPIAIGVLTKIVFLNNSTVTGIIDRLEKRELVRRVRISKDRRQVHVEITDQGMTFIQKAPTPIHQTVMEKLDEIDEKTISMILWSLEMLVDILGQTDPAAEPQTPPTHVSQADGNISTTSGI